MEHLDVSSLPCHGVHRYVIRANTSLDVIICSHLPYRSHITVNVGEIRGSLLWDIRLSSLSAHSQRNETRGPYHTSTIGFGVTESNDTLSVSVDCETRDASCVLLVGLESIYDTAEGTNKHKTDQSMFNVALAGETRNSKYATDQLGSRQEGSIRSRSYHSHLFCAQSDVYDILLKKFEGNSDVWVSEIRPLFRDRIRKRHGSPPCCVISSDLNRKEVNLILERLEANLNDTAYSVRVLSSTSATSPPRSVQLRRNKHPNDDCYTTLIMPSEIDLYSDSGVLLLSTPSFQRRYLAATNHPVFVVSDLRQHQWQISIDTEKWTAEGTLLRSPQQCAPIRWALSTPVLAHIDLFDGTARSNGKGGNQKQSLGRACSETYLGYGLADNQFIAIQCQNPYPTSGNSLVVDLLGSIVTAPWPRYSFRMFVFDEYNYNAWNQGTAATCINPNCQKGYHIPDGDVTFSAVIPTDPQNPYYYFILENPNWAGGITTFNFYGGISLVADVPQISAGTSGAWNRVSDFPYLCSYKVWPSSITIVSQAGTMVFMPPFGWTFLNIDQDFTTWNVFDLATNPDGAFSWNAQLSNAGPPYKQLSFIYNGNANCTVNFVAV